MEYFTTTSNVSRRAVDCVIVGIYERGKLVRELPKSTRQAKAL